MEVPSVDNCMVSICCVTYNHEPYIRETLEGFLNQKVKFRFEVLIHDDASTDGTQEIIKEFSKKFPEIIKPILREENIKSKIGGGVNIKYNMDRANGKYIALCEGDDYWIDPNKLQKQVDLLESDSEISLVFTARKVFYKKTNTWEVQNLKQLTYGIKDVNLSFVPSTQTVVFRRSEDIIGFLKSNLMKHNSSDQLLGLGAAKYGKIIGLKDVTSVYRETGDGAYTSRKNNFDFTIKLFSDFRNILKQEGVFREFYFYAGLGRKVLTGYGFKGSFSHCKVLSKLEIFKSISIYYIYRVFNLLKLV